MSTVSTNKSSSKSAHEHVAQRSDDADRSRAANHHEGVRGGQRAEGDRGASRAQRSHMQASDKLDGKEATDHHGKETGWQKSQIDAGEQGVGAGEHLSGGSAETMGVPTSPKVRDAVNQFEKEGVGKWVNEQYAAGDPTVTKFVDGAANNKLDTGALNQQLSLQDAPKDAAAKDAQAAGNQQISDGPASKLAIGDTAAVAAPAETNNTGGDAASGDKGESFAAAETKKLLSAFADALIARSIDDMDKDGKGEKKSDKSGGAKTGGGGGSKAGGGGSGSVGPGANLSDGGGTGLAGGGVDGSQYSSNQFGGTSDSSGGQSITSSGDSGGVGGLTGMELVQAVMLQAAAEAGKSAEDLAKQVQANTAQKNSLRQQMEPLRASLVGTTSDNMDPGQQANKKQLDDLQDHMDSIGDDNQLLFIKLQNASQQYQTFLQGVSNVSKNLFDISKAIVGNIGH